MDFKTIVSVIAIILIFAGYYPYLRDTIRGTTRPHAFSYFLWTLITFIIFGLQIQAGGGIGSWITFVLGFVIFVTFLISIKNGRRDIKKIDYVFLALALLSIPLWLVAKQPVLSAILLSTIDMLGFAPTIRKSWVDPWSETLSLYTITALRHGLAVVALVEMNIVTVLFPASWTLANALFAIMLIARRRVVPLVEKSKHKEDDLHF